MSGACLPAGIRIAAAMRAWQHRKREESLFEQVEEQVQSLVE